MPESLAAVVLAAGAGERLRPLTHLLPKPLCPVAEVPLLDRALARVRMAVPAPATAVNVHHHRDRLLAHLAATHPEVHPSIEPDRALGTAGALGWLRPWLAGRDVLVVNGDTWSEADLAPFVEEWDRDRIRILVHGDAAFGPASCIVAALHPWATVAPLEAVPAGLYEQCWREAADRGEVEAVPYHGPFVDCATPADYLRANLEASGGASVIGAGATVAGSVRSSVLWPGTHVHRAEHLVHAIRATDEVTVLVR